MVKVGKKWDKGAVYVGRGSPLGNKFVMANESDREYVCDAYEVWLQDRIALGDPVVVNELSRLSKLATEGDLILGCFCSPKRCHAESIKRVLDSGGF